MPFHNAVALLEIAEPVIRRIVRTKLRATLRQDDGREHNLDALDLLGDVRLKLCRMLEVPEDIASYAATIAYNTCSDYLRAKYPKRARLRNSIRRVIEKCPGLLVWHATSGALLCGDARFRQSHAARVADLQGIPLSEVDLDSPSDLLRLVNHAFEALHAPVTLDDLVAWVARCTGMQDVPFTPLDDEGLSVLDTIPSPQPSAESAWMASERMRLVWGAIGQLLPWHRSAYLLNLRDGELDAFPYYGVASIEQIREALDFRREQAARLAQACGVDLTLPASVQFAACWPHLPVDDNVLADVLEVTRPQIIAYRNKAIERLRRMLQGLR